MRLSQGSIPSGPKMRSYSTAKLPNMAHNNDKPTAARDEQKHELKLRNRGYSLSKIKMA